VTEVNTVNATAAALLGLLHAGPMTGGQLVAAAGERYGAFFSVTRSQVYRELPVLAEAGLLRLGARGVRASQQFAITPAGRRAFKAWLMAGEGTDHLRSPLILRVLHAGSLTVRQRRALIERGRSEYSERLVRAEEAAKSADSTPASAPYARAVAEFAVAHNRAVLALLDSVPTD
jgi:DNA-binding PadR family transcriptional regulator